MRLSTFSFAAGSFSVVGLAFVSGLLATTSVACSSSNSEDNSESSESDLASNVNVLTSRNDAARTSANPSEKILTTANVKAGSFGKVFTRPLDGAVYAQPLFVGGVGGKNVVYIATEHNSVYAFDADDLREDAPPLWKKSFGPPLPSSDTGCSLLAPEIGITATPVIDKQSKSMWFTARTKESGRVIHRLHKINIANGEERANSPVEITATAPGNGDTSVNGVITWDPLESTCRHASLSIL